MKGETRNQRRSRRRQETRGEREQQRFHGLITMTMNAPMLVFLYWAGSCMCGYIYNDNRFPNGTLVHTGPIVYNVVETLTATDLSVWIAKSSRTTYNVKRVSPRWKEVGAGDPLNRLKYKLWPKLVFMALLFRSRRRVYSPGSAAYEECKVRFEDICRTNL